MEGHRPRWPLRTGVGPALSKRRPYKEKESHTDRVLSAQEERIFEELKEWRKEEASLQGVPAYIVFGNKTLNAIAIVKPDSHAALERIPGVGPAKLDAYGDAILKLLDRI